MTSKERSVWDRLAGESSKAYANFCLYRDEGKDRSLRKLAASGKTSSKLRQLQHWSSKWKWVERSDRYDDYLECEDRLESEKQRREMRKRHAKIAVLGQNIVVRELESLLAKAQSGGTQMTASDVTRLMDVTVKIERLCRGEPTNSHEVSGWEGRPVRLTLEETMKKIAEFYGLEA